MCRLSLNLGASTSWNPLGLSRSIMGLHRQVPSRCACYPSSVPTETNHRLRPLKRQSCKTCTWETLVNAQVATKTTLISSWFSPVSSCTYRYVRYRYITYRYITYRYITYRYYTYRYITYRYITYRYITYRYIRSSRRVIIFRHHSTPSNLRG